MMRKTETTHLINKHASDLVRKQRSTWIGEAEMGQSIREGELGWRGSALNLGLGAWVCLGLGRRGSEAWISSVSEMGLRHRSTTWVNFGLRAWVSFGLGRLGSEAWISSVSEMGLRHRSTAWASFGLRAQVSLGPGQHGSTAWTRWVYGVGRQSRLAAWFDGVGQRRGPMMLSFRWTGDVEVWVDRRW